MQSEVAVSWAGSKRTGGSPSPQQEKSHHLGTDTHRRSAGEPEAGRSWEVIAAEAPIFCRAGASSRPPPWQGHWGGAGKRPGRNSAAVTSVRAGRALPPWSFEGGQSSKGGGPRRRRSRTQSLQQAVSFTRDRNVQSPRPGPHGVRTHGTTLRKKQRSGLQVPSAQSPP